MTSCVSRSAPPLYFPKSARSPRRGPGQPPPWPSKCDFNWISPLSHRCLNQWHWHSSSFFSSTLTPPPPFFRFLFFFLKPGPLVSPLHLSLFLLLLATFTLPGSYMRTHHFCKCVWIISVCVCVLLCAAPTFTSYQYCATENFSASKPQWGLGGKQVNHWFSNDFFQPFSGLSAQSLSR